MLRGRDDELDQLTARLDAAAAGTATAVCLAGEAGIGKSALLSAMAAAAAERGFRLLTARPSPLERVNAFAAVRQLIEPVLAGAPHLLAGAAANARLALEPAQEAQPDSEARALHGLQWLVANLCDEGPVLLVLDDAHWCDLPTLRFVAHLLRRAEGLPLAIALAARPEADRDVFELLDLVADDPLVLGLVPQPLDASAVAELAGEALGAVPEAVFVDAVVALTGGNPFYVHELLRAAAELGLAPHAGQVDRLEGLGPDGVARSVRRRVAAAGPDAEALAQALAVLEGPVSLPVVAAVAERAPGTVMAAADALVRSGVVAFDAEMSLAHRVVQNAVQDDVPPSQRVALRARAATALHAAGADPGRVAAHLLELPPRTGLAGFDVPAVLLAAARAAQAGGAPDLAERHLERALAEDLDAGTRRAALVALARVRLVLARPDSPADFAGALAVVEDRGERAALALEHVRGLTFMAQFAVAAPIAERELSTPDLPAEVRAALEIEAFHCALHDLEAGALVRATRAELLGRVEALMPMERAALGMALVFGGHDIELGTRLCSEAVLDEALLFTDPGILNGAIFALTRTDALELVDAVCTRLEAAGRELGSRRTFAFVSDMRGFQRLAQGDVRRAEEDILPAVEVAADELPAHTWPIVLAPAAITLVERGRPDEAATLLAQRSPPEPWPAVYPYALLRYARGVVALANGRPAEACADLDFLDHLTAGAELAPELLPWRSAAALARLALGDSGAGRALAVAEVRLAERAGVGRAVTRAQVAAALCLPAGDGQVAELRAAATGPPSLEHVRACVHLGAALRRAGRRVEARDVLRAGLDAAEATGAAALAALARAELVTAGARPRRDRTSGPEALTAAERRVAELAAAGASNRDVAQSLFLTTKTVEMHLSRSYRKLGIGSRAALSAALAGGR